MAPVKVQKNMTDQIRKSKPSPAHYLSHIVQRLSTRFYIFLIAVFRPSCILQHTWPNTRNFLHITGVEFFLAIVTCKIHSVFFPRTSYSLYPSVALPIKS